jgi:hypothetical protein
VADEAFSAISVSCKYLHLARDLDPKKWTIFVRIGRVYPEVDTPFHAPSPQPDDPTGRLRRPWTKPTPGRQWPRRTPGFAPTRSASEEP